MLQPDGRIGGLMQLYSIEKRQSEPIEGHAAGFARLTVEGAQKPSTLFVFAARTATGAKVCSAHIDLNLMNS